jgi:hypothetical protein
VPEPDRPDAADRLRGVALQLAVSVEESLDQRGGQTAAFADIYSLPEGPGPNGRRSGQVLLNDLGGNSAAFADHDPAITRPFTNRGRLSQVQLNYRFRDPTAVTDSQASLPGPSPHVGRGPLILIYYGVITSHKHTEYR